MQVNIVDAMTGMGKTSSLINYINSCGDDKRFLFITPYLNEVDRIIGACPNKNFKKPEENPTKRNGIKALFRNGENIASTHALFGFFDQEIIELAYCNNYILVMDEVANVVDQIELTTHDLKTIFEKYATVENHMLKWNEPKYSGKFDEIKNWCELGCVGVYNKTAILWLFPISTFKAFREIYILTYMFDVQIQKYYFDLHGIKYKKMYIVGQTIEDYNLSEEEVVYEFPDYKNLIHIFENDKINKIGDSGGALSKSWYKKNSRSGLLKVLKNNTINFFRNYVKTKSKFNLWTTFKAYENIISGDGYGGGFLSSNARATNEYRDRYAVAYLINKYFNPLIKNFFHQNGIEVDEDGYALSEMIQFLFRSAIRDGKEIWLYIPSRRMRKLLEDWLETFDK